jgi:hypothetical protein
MSIYRVKYKVRKGNTWETKISYAETSSREAAISKIKGQAGGSETHFQILFVEEFNSANDLP